MDKGDDKMQYICQECGNLVDEPFARDGDGYYCSMECYEEEYPAEEEAPAEEKIPRYEDIKEEPIVQKHKETKYDFFGNEKKPKGVKIKRKSLRIAFWVIVGFLMLTIGLAIGEQFFL
jgi:hypothetical protein